MRALIKLLVFLLATLAAASASAQVYKWVDERGVINYSNLPPVNPEAAGKLAVVEDRVSVYTPDKALLQAMEADRRGSGASARIAELERQLDAERRARQVAAVATPRPSDPCVDRAIDCAALSGRTYTRIVVVAVPPHIRPRHYLRTRPISDRGPLPTAVGRPRHGNTAGIPGSPHQIRSTATRHPGP